MTDKNWVLNYICQDLSTEPDYPFREDLSAVFRHRSSRKWFGILMKVDRRKFGLPEEASVDVITLKSGPIMSAVFRTQPGVFRAYHMNKEHWISVLLDGTVPEEELRQMIDLSYELTRPKGRSRKEA